MKDTFKSQCEALIKAAIAEDCPNGDVTVSTFFNSSKYVHASLIAKESGVFFGKEIIEYFFKLYDSDSKVLFHVNDGNDVKNKTLLCSIFADQSTLLLLERSMLNIIQRISGIASLTAQFKKKLNNNKIKICDTRKTTPGLRFLEKAAVKVGGGTNHRFNLSDMILIKENHLKVINEQDEINQLSIKAQQVKALNPQLKSMIEIESIAQLEQYNLESFDYILLDNFNLKDLPKAISFCRTHYPQIEIEISGNVSLDNIHNYSHFDIDRISVGSLTHSVKSFDISLLID